jgi:hypothetical protein
MLTTEDKATDHDRTIRADAQPKPDSPPKAAARHKRHKKKKREGVEQSLGRKELAVGIETIMPKEPAPSLARTKQRAAADAQKQDRQGTLQMNIEDDKNTSPTSVVDDVVYQPRVKWVPPKVAHEWDMTPEQWEAAPRHVKGSTRLQNHWKAVGKIDKAPVICNDTDSNAWGSRRSSPARSKDDPEEVIKRMVDWEGNLLPPPVDGVRHTFKDPKFSERFDAWLKNLATSLPVAPLYGLHSANADCKVGKW